MDEPTEKEGLIELIKTYPFINWKVIVNEQDHLPRNHAPVLNVGIRHATKKYVLVSDPEVEFYNQIPQTNILWLRNLWVNSLRLHPHFEGKRTYLSDFEVYDQRAADPNKAIVDIYIGIK